MKPNFTHYAKTIIITRNNRNEAQQSSADEQFSALPVQTCCPVGREANIQSGNTTKSTLQSKSTRTAYATSSSTEQHTKSKRHISVSISRNMTLA